MTIKYFDWSNGYRKEDEHKSCNHKICRINAIPLPCPSTTTAIQEKYAYVPGRNISQCIYFLLISDILLGFDFLFDFQGHERLSKANKIVFLEFAELVTFVWPIITLAVGYLNFSG